MNELDTRAERFLESIRAEGEAACAAIREETEREVTGRLDETRRAENARVERTLRFETERARTRANRDLSAARMAARAKLADQRQKIADETFAKAKAQLADFAASDKYAAWLQTEAAALAEALGENANLSVRSIDLPLLKGVKLPAGTTLTADDSIELGGLKGANAAKGLAADDTLAARPQRPARVVLGKRRAGDQYLRGKAMENKIYSINGPVVTIKGKTDLEMMEMVYVGKARLVGEVIRMNEKETTIQVYEETGGLKAGEPVESTGGPLSRNARPRYPAQYLRWHPASAARH